ncbi:MAG: P-type DNA transfer ATPase VirB11 [Halothiobacillaceae bacterium]|nr:P-type DNA transfer ATPase VirB11 [Halothiobacillaceae bacterium]
MKPADRSLTVRLLMQQYGISEALKGDITELAINEPGGFWVEDSNGWHYQQNEALTLTNLIGLATAINVYSGKKEVLDQDSPIASLTLPDGERCQIVMPPVCEQGKVSMTIRNPSDNRFTLADYANSGRMEPLMTTQNDKIAEWEQDLLDLAKQGRYEEFFEGVIAHRLNVVTVGGTGSGKTTFSKTLIDLFPTHRRIFTLEDAHELTTPKHPNAVHLFFSEKHSAKSILASCMRMKPDHIFITELRGDETWDYMMALKSGHSGSVTSIHANDCRGALYKMGSYIKQSDVGKTLDMDLIMREVETTIDVVLFFEKTYLRELYFDPINKLRLLRGERA